MKRRGLFFPVLTLLVAFLGADTTHATYPGQNGRIVFVSNRTDPDDGTMDFEIYSVDPENPNDVTQLTKNSVADNFPGVSGVGTMVFSRRIGSVRHVFRMDIVDGSNEQQVTFGDTDNAYAHISRDGRTIVFARFDPPPSEGDPPNNITQLWLCNSDGANLRQLTSVTLLGRIGGIHAIQPRFSPDGTRIAFKVLGPSQKFDGEVAVINTDGTGLQLFTKNKVHGGGPDWTPDGLKIVFFNNDSSRNKVGLSNLWIAPAPNPGDPPITLDSATNLTEGLGGDNITPRVSPDGTALTFPHEDCATIAECVFRKDIYVANIGGTTFENLTPNGAEFLELLPDWAVDIEPDL